MPASPSPASPEPLPVALGERFRCALLGCTLRAETCITRQAVSERQRTQQTSRGQGTDFPSCTTGRCRQGTKIRKRLDPDRLITWRGAGPGARFERLGRLEGTTYQRLRLSGALEPVPTIDEPAPAPW